MSVDSVVSSGPAPPPHPLHPRPQRRGMEVMRCDGRGRFLAGYYPMSQSHRAWRGQCKGIAGGPGSQNTCSQTFYFYFFFPGSRVGLPIRLEQTTREEILHLVRLPGGKVLSRLNFKVTTLSSRNGDGLRSRNLINFSSYQALDQLVFESAVCAEVHMHQLSSAHRQGNPVVCSFTA